jgi:hypothetical protein
MAQITSLDDYIASNKERIGWAKTTARTVVAGNNFNMYELGGYPTSASTMIATSASAGYMVNGGDLGFPAIYFTSGSLYVSKVEFNNTVASRLSIYDKIAVSGSYAFTAGSVVVSIYPDISSRCRDFGSSGSANFGDENEIWIEVCTAFATGNAWQVEVQYTNSDGTPGRMTPKLPVFAAAALTLGKMFRLPFQAGDSGVQKIEKVNTYNPTTAMTAGMFNVTIMRPIWTSGRIQLAYSGDIHDMLKTGLPLVFAKTAFYPLVVADNTGSGLPEIYLQIAGK